MLKTLVEESNLPLQEIESDFAFDSSGFSTCRFYKWVDAKYSDPKNHGEARLGEGPSDEQCPNIVTAVEVSERYANDAKYFKLFRPDGGL